MTTAEAFLALTRRVASSRRCTTAFLGDTGFCTRPLVGLCLLAQCAGLPAGPTPNDPPFASCLGAAGFRAGAAAGCCLVSSLACGNAAAAAVLTAPMLPLLLRLAGVAGVARQDVTPAGLLLRRSCPWLPAIAAAADADWRQHEAAVVLQPVEESAVEC